MKAFRMTLEGNGTVEPVLANFRCALKDLEEQFTHLVLNYAKVVDGAYRASDIL